MNSCRWCGGKLVRGDYHPACATPVRIWRHRGYGENYVPDTEGLVALLAAFWGHVDGTPDGSVRGDLRKGDWSVLRWLLGWDESHGQDFAWWCDASGVERETLTRRLLAEWRPSAHAPCVQCGHGYDRQVFQLASRPICRPCELHERNVVRAHERRRA